MPSFYNLATGAFAGNCASDAVPPDGYAYIAIDPTPGMANPISDGTAWQAGEAIPDMLPPPNWDGLVSAVMGNAEFKAAWTAAAAIDPTIAWSLPTAFGMVGQGHPGNFINLFEAICALATVSPAQRSAWADIGATFNAPTEFLDIVRGVGNGE